MGTIISASAVPYHGEQRLLWMFGGSCRWKDRGECRWIEEVVGRKITVAVYRWLQMNKSGC